MRRGPAALAALLLAACGAERIPQAPDAADVVARDLAAAYFGENQVKEARALLAPLAARESAEVEVLLAAAAVEIADGRLEVAERFLRRVGAIDPESAALHWNLARIARQRGDFDSALAHLRRTEGKAPGDLPTLLALGTTLAELDREEEARALLERILAVGVDHGGSWYMAALYHLAQGAYRRGDEAEAERRLGEFQRLGDRGLRVVPAGDADRGTFGKVAPPPGEPSPEPPEPEALGPPLLLPEAAGCVEVAAVGLDEEAPADAVPGEPIHTRVALPALLAWGEAGLVSFERGPEGGWSARRLLAEPVAALESLDAEGDGDLDLALLVGSDLRLLERRDGDWAAGTTLFAFPGAPRGLEAVDYDHDGDLDLAVAGEFGAILLRREAREGGWREGTEGTGLPRGAPLRRAVVIDLDRDGDIDVLWEGPDGPVLADNLRMGRFGVRPDGSAAAARALAATPGRVVADLDGDGRPDLVRVVAGGLDVRMGGGPPRPSLRVVLRAIQDNRRGVGALVEVRAGAVLRRIPWRGEPVLVDLGDAERADLVRVHWPNGVVQAVIRPPPGRECLVVQREGHVWSCPFLYVVEGGETVFRGEMLSGAASPGAPRRAHRDIRFLDPPRVVGADGRVVVHLTEEQCETTHLDAVRLLAPSGALLPLLSARLSHRGFGARLGAGRSFDRLDASIRLPRPPLAATPYGDVLPLVSASDSRLAVLAPGDLLTLVFSVPVSSDPSLPLRLSLSGWYQPLPDPSAR